METVIGMLLAFILGAVAVIITIAVINPDLLKKTYSASVVSVSDQLQRYESAITPMDAKQKEEEDEIMKELVNIFRYSGKKQGEIDD